MTIDDNTVLAYSNQLEFRHYALDHLIPIDAYYFDKVSCVDAKTDEDIPGITANGSLTWSQAIHLLRWYFIDKRGYLRAHSQNS